MKQSVLAYLSQACPTLDLYDIGTGDSCAVDYPDYARLVVDRVQHGVGTVGILCCGTGIGMSIMANRYKGIRAAVVTNDHMATMAKQHNDANIICLGGRILDEVVAHRLVSIWLETPYTGGRHDRRLAKLDGQC